MLFKELLETPVTWVWQSFIWLHVICYSYMLQFHQLKNAQIYIW